MENSQGGNDRLRRLKWALIVLVVVAGALGTALIASQAGYEASMTWGLAALGAVAAAVGVSIGAWREARSSEEATRSRQRVRDAESALELALREQAGHTIHAFRNVTVHGPVRVDGRPDPVPPQRRQPDGSESDTTEAVDLALPALWGVTHARLAAYHVTAVGQAEKAFRNAQYAMAAGFVLLGVFVYAAFHAKSAAGTATAGALGAVAAALSGYIARTFIKSQEMTSAALHRYFEEPLVLSRYLAAERLVRDAGLSEEHQAELLRTIVHSMIVGELPGKPAATPEAEPAEE